MANLWRGQLCDPLGARRSSQVNDFLAAGKAPAWFTQQQREAKRKARQEARRRRHRVVVVGAGPAGLTAALHLKAGWAGRGTCSAVRTAVPCVQGTAGLWPRLW